MHQEDTKIKAEVTLRLSPDLIATVDRIRKRVGATRTEWLRRAISAATVIDTLAEEIEEALDHTWQIYIPTKEFGVRSMEDLIRVMEDDSQTPYSFTFPDSWLEPTKEELMQQANRELNMLPVSELHQLIDEERGEQRRERVILRYVAAAIEAADQFRVSCEETTT